MSVFTADQSEAIAARGNVLVVAGAGTGKTRTLVQRCIDWLLQAPGDNSLEQVLMVTFTDAAAAEMRQRIREELKRQIAHSASQPQLTEQLALLETAFISTLHSFCFRLVREHFYELDLDPNLAIYPEEESRLLAEETLSAILDKHYAGTDSQAKAVQRLIQTQARGWDVPIRRLVLRLHRYAQTLPDPEAWHAEQLALFADPEARQWHEWLAAAIADWRRTWLELLPSWAASAPNVARCLASINALPPQPDVAEAHTALQCIREALEAPWPRGTAGKVRDRLSDFFAESDFLFHLTNPCALPADLFPEGGLAGSPLELSPALDDPLAQDWGWVRADMQALLTLAREFQREFAHAKRELGVVDFHDLEQFSLQLLWNRAEQRPTLLAETWRRKLRLVFVDEYQDINAAQDAILRALAGDGNASNRFLVGDPKQSIYRFRLAAPHIFQQYVRNWGAELDHGQVIALRENFRSHEGILELINSFFAGVMRAEIGGVPYDENARLRFGSPEQAMSLPAEKSIPAAAQERPSPASPTGPLPAVELHLRLSGNGDSGQSSSEDADGPAENILAALNSAEIEARLLGLRLAQLRADGFLICDRARGTHRPVAWKDMVVLLRSPRGKAECYAKEFARLGIPLIADRGGFFDSLAVSDLLSVLSLLDNPLQDIPVLAVLRSPIVGLSMDELALIRLAGRGRFWTALNVFHRLAEKARNGVAIASSPDDKLRQVLLDPARHELVEGASRKVGSFLGQFAGWRRVARQTSISECLDRILTDSQYLAFLRTQPRAQQQCGNVAKLLSWARQFDQFQRHGLYRFLKFIEAQREAEIEHEPAPLDTDDAVRLMSIHQSKGLEFGVVAVGDLGKAFNLSDLRGDIILDETYGLCPAVKAPFTEQRYPSLPYWLAQRRQRRETLGEEMRLLYVAMTRACQRLLLVGTATTSALERWAAQAQPATIRELMAARSYLDWLGPWLREGAAQPDWAERLHGQSRLLAWTLYTPEDPRLQAPGPGAVSSLPASQAAAVDRNAVEALARKLSWRYPHAPAARQAAKLSVSGFQRAIIAAQADEEPRSRPFRAPASRVDGRMSAAEIGTAHHAFLQFVSLDAPDQLRTLEEEAVRLVEERILTASERDCLDLRAIAAFWLSPIGQDIRARQAHVHRELPFTCRLPLWEARQFEARLGAGTATDTTATVEEDKHEFIILTGIVDLAVLLPDEIWMLDFKTDDVKPGEWKQKAQQYRPQMQLYAQALSRIYQRNVTRCWLHSIPLCRTLECSDFEAEVLLRRP